MRNDIFHERAGFEKVVTLFEGEEEREVQVCVYYSVQHGDTPRGDQALVDRIVRIDTGEEIDFADLNATQRKAVWQAGEDDLFGD